MPYDQDTPLKILIEAFYMICNVFKSLSISIYRFCISPEQKSVNGDIVLITGSGGEIGRLLSLEFSKLGAILVLWDINTENNEGTAELIKDNGGECYTYTVDVGDHDQILKAVQRVKQEVGEVSILINNAAVVTGRSLLASPDEMIDRTFKVNLVGQFWTVKYFLPSMLKRNHGHVVNIASSAGIVGLRNLADYSASKYGVMGFSEVLNLEIVFSNTDGVYTTVVCPSFVKTNLFNGCTMKFPKVVPPLDVKYVAEKIVHAILTNQTVLFIPRSIYFVAVLKTILPVCAMNAIVKYMGAADFMDNFIHHDNGNVQGVPNRSLQFPEGRLPRNEEIGAEVEDSVIKKQT